MSKLFEAIYWLKIFMSPFLFLNGAGVILFYIDRKYLWAWLLLGSMGIILGVYWAEKVRKKKGTIRYMSEIYSSNDILSFEEIAERKDDPK
jgi:hypothetical protein